jgi:hypothetical protein
MQWNLGQTVPARAGDPTADTTINRAILITADNIGGYCSGPFQPSSLTPSTASAHINGLSYSLRVMRWWSNAMQKSRHAF